MYTFGEGKFKVWLKKDLIGMDIVLMVGGGEKAHIGGITTCEPGKQATNHELEGHYDCTITEPIAVAACEKYKRKAVCIGGVHIKDATKEEIDQLVKNCKELVRYV